MSRLAALAVLCLAGAASAADGAAPADAPLKLAVAPKAAKGSGASKGTTTTVPADTSTSSTNDTPAVAKPTVPATEVKPSAAAPRAPSPPERPAEPLPRNDVHGRVDVSQLYSFDSDTNSHYSWTDARVMLDGVRLTDANLGFKVDGRFRLSWTSASDNRLAVSDLFVRQGAPESTWRFTLGRQTIRAVGSAQVDGAAVERKLGDDLRLVVFGGLMPHPFTNMPNLEFITAGAGYEYNKPQLQHAGGVAMSLYGGGLDRLYLTHRLTMFVTQQLMLTSFILADMDQPHGLLGNPGPDLTNVLVLARYRPIRLLDVSLSLSHLHTILPGKWWADWIADELRRRGFVLDGLDPVGTRVTSVRATLNVNLNRMLVPFLRLRFDERHTEARTGGEALGGLKLRPGKAFFLVQGGYRQYFEAQVGTASAEGGYEGELMGGQAGGQVIARSPLPGSAGGNRLAFEAHASGWMDLGAAQKALEGVMLSANYQLLVDTGFAYHVAFLQVGYRF